MKLATKVVYVFCGAVLAGSFWLPTLRAEAPAAPKSGEPAAAKQYESFGTTQIIEMEPVRDMFSHKAHVVTAGLKCESCHPALFDRKRGSTAAKGDYTMAALDAGKYCGSCHDGKTAFNTTGPETCKKCHGSDMKQPEMVVFNKPVKAVVFGHKEHVEMGLSCASCHAKEFEMRKGAAEEHPEKFNMQALYAGKYCGVCHNGNIAFASDTRCTSCHIGVKGLAKMMNTPKDTSKERHK